MSRQFLVDVSNRIKFSLLLQGSVVIWWSFDLTSKHRGISATKNFFLNSCWRHSVIVTCRYAGGDETNGGHEYGNGRDRLSNGIHRQSNRHYSDGVVMRQLNSVEDVVDSFVEEAFLAGDYLRILRYRLIYAIGSSEQFDDDANAEMLLHIKKDGSI